jgi:predicted ATP-grasp superfamily ATP-dependent carboligase
MQREILIFGPSARAAAASAMRSGLRPHCIDLFADRDLVRAVSSVRIAMNRYPDDLTGELAKLPSMPYLFLGGLENRIDVLDRIDRPRWGMGSETLANVRNPLLMEALLGPAELCPLLALQDDFCISSREERRWLLKSRSSAAGLGVRFAKANERFDSETHYLQEFVEGMPASAVFVADSAGKPRLLGVTRQLIGTPWLRSSGFLYAGNVGPWPVSHAVVDLLERAAQRMTEAAFPLELRGLFGIDFILRDDPSAYDKIAVVEVNPRYPASVEVLERTSGQAFLAAHRAAFEPADFPLTPRQPSAKVAAKGILYAKETLLFPTRGPWMEAFDYSLDDLSVPYADIPHPGDRIEKGHPILTLFASAEDPQTCLEQLQEKAAFVESRLFSAAK